MAGGADDGAGSTVLAGSMTFMMLGDSVAMAMSAPAGDHPIADLRRIVLAVRRTFGDSAP